MTKYILVGGYIHKAPDGGRAFCEEIVKGVSHNPVRILDCLFARPKDSWGERFQDDKEFFSKHITDCVVEIASPDNFIDQLQNSDILFFQGGIPRQLMELLNTVGDWRKELDGKVVVATSGGADALCKYYGVGKTLNVGEGLGLVPIKFIPHWKSDYHQTPSADWDILLEKLKSHKEDLDIVTLREGEFHVIEKG